MYAYLCLGMLRSQAPFIYPSPACCDPFLVPRSNWIVGPLTNSSQLIFKMRPIDFETAFTFFAFDFAAHVFARSRSR